MRKILLALCALLLLASSGYAMRGSIATVSNLTCSWKSTCAVFEWTGVSGADFNNFRIQTTSNNRDFSGLDVNTTGDDYVLCTLAAGEWVEATVVRYDGNASDIFMNAAPDANCLVKPGSPLQAGRYLLFNVFYGVGSIILLVIIAAVLIFLLAKFGFGKNLLGGFGRK